MLLSLCLELPHEHVVLKRTLHEADANSFNGGECAGFQGSKAGRYVVPHHSLHHFCAPGPH